MYYGEGRAITPVWHFVNGVPQVGPLTIGTAAVTSTVPLLAPDGTAAAPAYSFASETTLGLFRGGTTTLDVAVNGAARFRFNNATGLILDNGYALAFGATLATPDILLVRDAANTLALRNGVNAQTFNLYGTFTNAANYERLNVLVDSTAAQIYHIAAGTGTQRPLYLGAGNANRWAISTNGSLTSLGNYPLGYGAGAGGTVTQLTSKATSVTLNTVTGEITLNAAALAAATAVSFTLTDSAIAAGDYVMVQHVSAGTLGAYVTQAVAAAGSASVTVTNRSAGSLAEAIVLKFVLIKAVTS